MELNFDFNSERFSESLKDDIDDFVLKKDEIIPSYKYGSKPHAIRIIKARKHDTIKFIEERPSSSPSLFISIWYSIATNQYYYYPIIYFPITEKSIKKILF